MTGEKRQVPVAPARLDVCLPAGAKCPHLGDRLNLLGMHALPTRPNSAKGGSRTFSPAHEQCQGSQESVVSNWSQTS